jgi:beta-lactamase superfamily II metal-dependent hydrolase
MLIDGGPNDKALTCLGKHMPFYDRTIDMVVLSHPQKDHLQGMLSVIERYSVKYIVIGVEGNETEGYKRLLDDIAKKKIPVKHLYRGDSFSLGEVKFSVLWPERQWVAERLSHPLSDISYLSDPRVLGLSTTTNLNDFSFFLHLQYGSFDALFTGDGEDRIQSEVLSLGHSPEVEIVKVPHHGSKKAFLPLFLDEIRPEYAVVSVGKNPYGHPTKETIELLRNRAIKILRTDERGDIEVVADGRSFRVLP